MEAGWSVFLARSACSHPSKTWSAKGADHVLEGCRLKVNGEVKVKVNLKVKVTSGNTVRPPC